MDSGFVEGHCAKFAERGDFIRVAVRNPLQLSHKALGKLGRLHQFKPISSTSDITRAVQGSDVVINLVGILYEKGSQTFESIHVEGAKRVAKAAAKEGVPTLLHMSALGADKRSHSRYASSKARGEAAVLKYFPKATLFRPSIIFGPGDAFFNRFASMARLSPFLPLIGGGKTKMQPIYVGDVANCFVEALRSDSVQGKYLSSVDQQSIHFGNLWNTL